VARIEFDRRKQSRQFYRQWPTGKYYAEGAAIAVVIGIVWLNAARFF
jgi:hypothetical protein